MKLIKISSYLVLSLFLLSLNINTMAEGIGGKKSKVLKTTSGTPAMTKFNINNVSTYFGNDGVSDYSTTGDAGFQYPLGSGHTVFFESGFLYGGYVNGEWRVSGSTYNRGQVPGRILANGTRESSDLSYVRIYRVRRDYAASGADYSKEISDEGKTQAEVYAQYDKDWKEWPAQYGAPFEDKNGNGTYEPTVDVPGVPGADQTIWFVCNDLDATQCQKLYGTIGLGLEMQATIWGYNQQNALGDALFRKYTVINKGGNKVDSMYVCMWSDPDLGGDSGDDFAGCDTTLSLGFIYNGDDADPSYGAYIPSAGFDFMQGPIIPAAATDRAIFKNKYRYGYRNMPMTAFFLFTQSVPNWTDPTLGSYANGALQVRNLFQGKIGSLGTPFTDPLTGQTTKFCCPGDPVTGKGWVDGILFIKQDRRIGCVAGTFTLAPGDTQEVVVGQLAAGGVAPISRIGAVAKLKFNDKAVQLAYDNFFQVPSAPAAPSVTINPVTKLGVASEFDKKLIISWGEDQAAVAKTESHDNLGYKFEGYVVYQLPSLTASLSQAVVIATYDLATDPAVIISASFDPNTNQETKTVNKKGENSGISRSITIDKDYIRGGIPLANGTTYYYVVSSYAYNSDPDIADNVLESLSAKISATPHAVNPGTAYNGTIGQSLVGAHSAGSSDGTATAVVYDPSKVTGHSYEVSFADNSGSVVWNLKDKTKGTTVLSNQTNQDADANSPLVDGLQVKVGGPAIAFKNFQVTANANGALATPISATMNWGGYGWANAAAGQQKNGTIWVLGSNSGTNYDYAYWLTRVVPYAGGYGEAVTGIAALIPDDFEFRFTAAGSEAFFHWTTKTCVHVPFEIWDTRGTATTADDFKCFACVLDNDANGQFNLTNTDNIQSGGSNDPQTDAIYFIIPTDKTPGDVGYKNLLAKIKADGAAAAASMLWAYKDATYGSYPGMQRLVFVGFNLIDVSLLSTLDPAKALPETGTIFKIITTKPNAVDDKFTFTAPTVTTNDAELAKQEVEKINVFPNPYYAVNPREVNKYQRFVTFSHLPQKATIRIFNLAGQLVRILQKDSQSQFTTWDLQNGSDFPVASGLYIIHVDMPDLGKEKVIKLAVIQEQQILDHF